MKKIYFMLFALICMVIPAKAAVVTSLDQLSNDKLYTIRSARGFLMYSANVSSQIAFSTGKSVGNVQFNSQDPNQQFKIEYKNGKYYLYSVGAGKYVGNQGKYANSALIQLKLESSGGATYRWKLGLGNYYMNSQEAGQLNEGIVVNDWSKTDDGNSYRIDEVVEGEGGDTGGDTTSSEVYDFSGFGDEALMELFYNALQQGRNYPTMEEFAAAGIQASDIAFVRSHVRRANIMSREDRVRKETYQNRNLFLNIPMDYGKDGGTGYPEAKFNADVFSMWQYTNLFGSWNHGFFQAPGAWVDAAHRNGTDIMSGIAFFESWTGDGDKTFSAMITRKNSDGTYKYVKPLINILMFFGSDGINYNWEATGYDKADVVNFHKQLYKYAEEIGFDSYHSAIYTSVSSLSNGSSTIDALYGTKATGKTHDLMLNYQANDIAGGLSATYNAVVNGESDIAVLPIENSYAGEVGQTMDLIFSGGLFINGIYELEIHQNLLGIPSATVEDIKKVTSHPQALSQCHDYIEMRGFLHNNLNNSPI